MPIITKDYVFKVDGNRIELKNCKVTENCRFEANMGMIHRGEPRTIPIIMEAKMEDKKKWGDILGGNLGDLLYYPCFTDNDVDKAVDLLAWQMENAKKSNVVNKENF